MRRMPGAPREFQDPVANLTVWRQAMLDKDLLDILACPHCVSLPERAPEGVRKGEMELLGTEQKPEALRCKQCRRVYKIEDGIPNLLIEEAVIEGQA